MRWWDDMRSSKVAQYGLFVALAILMGYVEMLIPLPHVMEHTAHDTDTGDADFSCFLQKCHDTQRKEGACQRVQQPRKALEQQS